MLEILTITAPIFLLIGLGFVACRFEVIPRSHISSLGAYVITFALPALIIKALSSRPIGQVLDTGYLLAYCLGSLTVFAGGLWYSLKIRKDSLSSSSITALGMSASNSAFVGYPIVSMLVGPSAAVELALCMIIENLIMIPLTLALALAENKSGESTAAMLRTMGLRLLRNPIIIAIAIGVFFSVTRLSIPPIPLKVIDMLAASSAPVALFFIGGSLYGLRPQGLLPDLTQISVGKLLLHPLAVFMFFAFMPNVTPEMKLAGVIMASAPMMSVYPIIGQRVGLQSRCAAALVFATMLSFLTMSLLIGVVR